MILSVFKEPVEIKKDLSITRVIWLMPSIFCAFILASAGADIILNSDVETVTSEYEVLNSVDGIIVLNSTTVTTSISSFTLLQPVWVALHSLFFMILVLYVIWNIVSLLTKT